MIALLLAEFLLAQPQTPPSVPPQPRSVRPAPRPEKTAQEYADEAVRLRTLYTQPPKDWPAPTIDRGVEFVELGPTPQPLYPQSEPYSAEKAELGKLLFFDPRLSGSRQIACASCHDPDLAWADGRTTSFGHGRLTLERNAPSIMNSGFAKSLFWDGRAATLEQQAIAVFLNPEEMHGTEKDIVAHLSSHPQYLARFKAAFGTPVVTLDRVGAAVATFERGIVGGRSRFDQFLKGKSHALTDAEIRGLHLFRTDARCANCHHGPLLTDDKFHDIGLSYYGRKYEDLGRFRITRAAGDSGAFRTPSLRNVGRTAPYMHNGLFELAGVLNMYNAGSPTIRKPANLPADAPPFPTKSPLLKPLRLNRQDLSDLQAFLLSLNEPRLRVRAPELPDATD